MSEIAIEPVRLRGHHLVCLQFLHGGGYSLEFARNILHLRERFEREGGIAVSGHDDVCTACPRYLGIPRTCMMCPDSEEQVDELDAFAYELLDVAPGDPVDADDMRERISHVLPQWRERACSACAWADMCSVSINLLSRA